MRKAMIGDGLNDLVLDRLDGIVPFFHLSKSEYRQLVAMKVGEVLRKFHENNPAVQIKLKNEEAYIDRTLRETFHSDVSNREALASFSQNLRVLIAREVVGRNGKSTIIVDLGSQARATTINGSSTCEETFSVE